MSWIKNLWEYFFPPQERLEDSEEYKAMMKWKDK